MSKKEILQFLKKTIANSHKVCDNSKCNIEVWLSLVEHHVRDVGVASSNLVTSTKKILPFSAGFFYVKKCINRVLVPIDALAIHKFNL